MAIMTPVSSLPISSQSLAFSVAMPHSVSPELSASNPMLVTTPRLSLRFDSFTVQQVETHGSVQARREVHRQGEGWRSDGDDEEEPSAVKEPETMKRSADEDLGNTKTKKR
eukprot:764580-Hanusia_phi.AAC.1